MARVLANECELPYRLFNAVTGNKKDLDKLFLDFERVDMEKNRNIEGTGLGLAISKQITELHGGSITAKSSPEYTDFTVVLPYVNAEYLTEEQLDF